MSLLKLTTAIALVLTSGAVAAGTERLTVLELYNRVPPVPATAAEAAKWVDKQGTLVHPGLIALRADIAAHRRSVEALMQVSAQQAQAHGAAVTQDLAQGMSNVGIDMARMQSDPAYAREVQARMRAMSPAELMAMSQAMNRPLAQDRRLTNEAQAMADDSDAVKAAAEAGFEYSTAQVGTLEAYQKAWEESERAVATITAKPLPITLRKPTMEYDNIGCDGPCQNAWHAYAAHVMPMAIARDTEILVSRRATFERERAALAPRVAQASRHLLATQYGAASQSQANRSRIVGYDVQILGDIELLTNKLEDIVKSAALRTNCGEQTVLVPGAVCQ